MGRPPGPKCVRECVFVALVSRGAGIMSSDGHLLYLLFVSTILQTNTTSAMPISRFKKQIQSFYRNKRKKRWRPVDHAGPAQFGGCLRVSTVSRHRRTRQGHIASVMSLINPHDVGLVLLCQHLPALPIPTIPLFNHCLRKKHSLLNSLKKNPLWLTTLWESILLTPFENTYCGFNFT